MSNVTRVHVALHNIIVQDVIGRTPFELGHGSAARTLVTGAALGVSSLDKCAAPSEDEVRGYYGRVKAAASEFSEVASRVMKDAREAQNARLNESSRAREFAVGDIVSIYCPSSGIDSKWKPKHKIKWRGPMEVVSRLSATAYGMRELSSGQYFERTVCNINSFRAAVDPRVGQAAHSASLAGNGTPSPAVAKTVAMVENGEFWIAEVTSDAEEFSCHYWATTGRNVESAVFKPA